MLRIIKVKGKETKRFEDKEWHKIDLEHYGRKIPQFVSKNYYFKALLKNEIVGTIEGRYDDGIIFIADLIVAERHRGNKIGEKLINKAIAFGKKYQAHKIYLYTGIDWTVNEFYQKLGFKKVGVLLNHYFHKDFNIYEKAI